MPFVSIYDTPPAFGYYDFASVQFTADIFALDSSRRIEKVPRVYVGETEIAVRSVTWTVDETRTGVIFSAVLHRITDRSLLVEGALITFQLGSRPYAKLGEAPVAFTYETIIDEQKLENVQFEMAGDTVSFTTYPSNKLTLAPTENLIISPTSIDVSEMEVIRDDQGRTYSTEVFVIGSMTWLDAANEIYVERLEFDSIETDIEDFESPALRFPIAEPYSKGFAPAIGTFNPRFYAVGNVLHIKNGWAVVPSDFPEPRDLTFEGCEQVQIVREFSQADMARLTYSVSNNTSGDYVTLREELKTTDNGGSLLAGDLVTYVSQRIFRQFRNFAAPDVVQSEELGAELNETYNGLDVNSNLVHSESLGHSYDSLGQVISTSKTVGEKVPDPDNEGEFIWVEESKTEYTDVEYGQHPFDVRRTYEKKIVRRLHELHSIDTAKPYKWNRLGDTQFNQPLSDADRAGNLDEFTLSDSPLPVKTFTQNFYPQRNGQLLHNATAYDNVQQRQIYSFTDPKTGSTSLGGLGATQTMYVFETAETTKGQGTIVDVAGGVIPLRILIPLCRTILLKLRTRNRRAVLNRIPIDTTIDLSTQFTAKDKTGNLEGKFRVSSYTCSGQSTDKGNSWSMQITGMEL